MGNCCSGSSLKLRDEIGYYNYTGTMIKHQLLLPVHNADAEYSFVTSHDKSSFEAGEECYLIHSEWLSSWLRFASEENDDPFPKVPISNERLMQADGKSILRSIAPKKDFRPVSKAVWEYLFAQYGGGPVISFLVPEGLKESNYVDGTWIKRVKVHDIVSIAFPVNVQQLSSGGDIALKATLRYHSDGSSNPLVLSDVEMLALEALTKNRTAGELNKESQRVAAEADLATKQGVAMMFAGKDASFDEAVLLNEQSKAMEESANETAMAGALAMFQDKDDSRKHREEAVLLTQQADALQQETGIAASEVVVQHLLSGLSSTLKDDAKDAKNEQLAAAETEVVALMLKGSAKSQFAAARKLGRLPDMQRAAAMMLQNAWRGKVAKRKAQLLKEKRIRLLEEAYARRLQTIYRAHIAKRKVEQMKEEVRRLRLLAQTKAALAIQSSWRRKIARRKMLAAAAMRAESRRLRALAMEKAATAIQCSWRRKIARRKMQLAAELRKESLRLLTEARQRAALTIQCAWRWSKSVRHCGLRAIRSAAARVIWHRWRAVSIAREVKNAFVTMQLSKLRVFSVHLKHANNLLIGDVTSSDPYVYIHGEVSEDTNIGSRRPSSVSKGRRPSHQGTTPTLCCYRSKMIRRNLNPVWDETCLLAGLSCKDRMMLTIMDKDTFSNDDCLGQVVVPLARYPQLARKEEMSLSDVTVEALETSVYDAKGKEVTTSVAALPKTNPQAPSAAQCLRGTISFSIRLNSFYRAHSGWVVKKSKGIMTSFKQRFMILDDSGHLSYFDDSHTLEHPRGAIDCKNIARISLYLQPGRGNELGSPSAHGQETLGSKVVLDMKVNGEAEDWVIQWESGIVTANSEVNSNVVEIDESISVWIRKIQYSCAKGVTVNQATGSFVKRLEGISKLPLAEPQGGSAAKKKGGYIFG